MTEIVRTESGAAYEFDGMRVRRINTDHEKRGDGEWQTLVTRFPKTARVGVPMVIVMGSLAAYGVDDIGTPASLASPVTTRRTTRVVSVEATPDSGNDSPKDVNA